MTIDVEARKGSSRLRLRVKPGGRRDRLVGAHAGALKLEVTAPPERGKANAAVVRLLAKTFGVPRRDIEITAGDASQDKTVQVALPHVEVVARLEAAGIEARAVDSP